MNGIGVFSLLSTCLQLTVPSYALRLVRRFGAQNVGWFVVLAFSALAALYLVRPIGGFGGRGGGSSPDLVYILASGLLLLGMGHVEGICSERQRARGEQQRWRSQWESQLHQETAGLTRANQELLEELARREAAAKALEASETQYRCLFTENPVPMWIFDRCSGRFLAVNPAALRHYGFTRDEFMALTARDLLPADAADAFLREVAQPCSGTAEPSRWRHLKKDLTLIDVEVTTADIDFGNRPARLVLAHDVSLRVSHDRAWHEAQKMGVLRQVAGGVAHHFNNILTVIEGHTSLMLLDRQAADPEEELTEVSKAAHRAAAITRQLLIASGQHLLHRELVEMNVLLLKLNPTLCRLVGDHVVFEHTSYARQLPLILADPRMIEHVIVNLVLNARQAMPRGGNLTLNTSCVQLDPPSDQPAPTTGPVEFVCLTVRDTGCGMTPEVRARLFEPFFTTRDVGQALGLGLASVRGVVQQHGGRIEVVSEPGAGTEVRILFPCA